MVYNLAKPENIFSLFPLSFISLCFILAKIFLSLSSSSHLFSKVKVGIRPKDRGLMPLDLTFEKILRETQTYFPVKNFFRLPAYFHSTSCSFLSWAKHRCSISIVASGYNLTSKSMNYPFKRKALHVFTLCFIHLTNSIIYSCILI